MFSLYDSRYYPFPQNKKTAQSRSSANFLSYARDKTLMPQARWETVLSFVLLHTHHDGGLLLAQSEPLDQHLVLLGILSLQIIQQLAATAYHPQQTPPGMMILDMGLEMLGKIGDPRRQQRDLNFRRTGIALGSLVIFDQLAFLSGCYRHFASPTGKSCYFTL
jgi:hypothetical protein